MNNAELLTNLLTDLQSIFREKNKNLPFSLSQIILISSIPEQGIDMTSLSKKIGIDNSTTTRLIHNLQKKDIIIKSSNIEDKRSSILTLSKKGIEANKSIEENIEKFSKQIFSYFEDKNRILTKDLLSAFHWNLLKYRLNNK
jgi:DNA-binding MarR family transcriptional regulator